METLLGNTSILYPIIGGALIGLASIGLMLFNGRIAGISGIVKGALRIPKNDLLWRIAFILGMILTGIAIQNIYPELFLAEIDRSIWAYAAAGLLIGIGTGLANGCTSGHGVCGVGRLSNRSVTITMAFTLSGIITVWLINSFFGGMI
jgi:uncharacterized protein